MKKIIIGLLISVMLVMPVGLVMAVKPSSAGTCTLANGNVVATGFDQYGYNRCAHQFVGTGSSWCLARGASANCLGIYSPDKLVMKWNAEWDRGNAEGWSDPNGYRAWENKRD